MVGKVQICITYPNVRKSSLHNKCHPASTVVNSRQLLSAVVKCRQLSLTNHRILNCYYYYHHHHHHHKHHHPTSTCILRLNIPHTFQVTFQTTKNASYSFSTKTVTQTNDRMYLSQHCSAPTGYIYAQACCLQCAP